MSKPVSDPITLDQPIVRGTTQITELVLRRPNSGELRGVSMLALMQMQPEAIFTVLPRICDPVLLPAEMNKIDPADLMQIGTAMASFFIPKHLQMDELAEPNGKTLHS